MNEEFFWVAWPLIAIVVGGVITSWWLIDRYGDPQKPTAQTMLRSSVLLVAVFVILLLLAKMFGLESGSDAGGGAVAGAPLPQGVPGGAAPLELTITYDRNLGTLHVSQPDADEGDRFGVRHGGWQAVVYDHLRQQRVSNDGRPVLVVLADRSDPVPLPAWHALHDLVQRAGGTLIDPYPREEP